uniref:Nucleolar protein 11 n=1 Tax=Glossina pallidipes TaxID=7398 RepID=A0A1A9ZKK8_GLOPL
MTKFINYYNLCPIPEPKDFLGIAADKEKGNIITTLSKNIVIIITISTQKQVRSWSVVEKLSSKVVYDKRSEKYVGVFGNKTLRCWDESTADVNKSKKLRFHKNISELVTNEKDTFVLYDDGSFESLKTAIDTRKEGKQITSVPQHLQLLPDFSLNKGRIFTLPSGKQILTYFETNHTSGECHLVRLPLEDENLRQRYPLKRGNLQTTVCGAAVIEGDGVPLLCTIWSDKRIFLLTLDDCAQPERSPGTFVSMLTHLKVDSCLSLLGLSGHSVAIYGANYGQKKESEGASLLLYNLQYKVIKVKQFFKVYFDFSKLWSIDNHILLALGQNLSVVQYRVSKELLSELVGTQVCNDYQTSVEGDQINEDDCIQDYLQYTTSIGKCTELEYLPKRTYHFNEADGKSVAFIGIESFEKDLNHMRHTNLHVDVRQASAASSDDQITLMSNHNDDGFTCRKIQIIASQMEKAGASEHEITEKLLWLLIKAELLPDIGVCLKRYTNISEKMLSKTLNFILKQFAITNPAIKDAASNETLILNGHRNSVKDIDFNSEDKSEKDKKNKKKLHIPCSDRLAKEEGTLQTEIKDILNTLLSCNFDFTAIGNYIRQDIGYSEALILLEHLYDMLTDPDITGFQERPSHEHTSVEFELQILRWFGVFLNTHFQKLALSKDVKLIEILLRWQELFIQYKHEIIELQETSALLYNIIQCKKLAEDRDYSKWYSIEQIHLF